MDEKQAVESSPFEVTFGQIFIDHFNHFPIPDQDKIYDFVEHLENRGVEGLPGRNKSSEDVPKEDPQFLAKVKYAQKYNLWHYHIGIPFYDEDRPYGDWTSEYVVHYILKENEVILVDMGDHPPLQLPKENYLS